MAENQLKSISLGIESYIHQRGLTHEFVNFCSLISILLNHNSD